jgi:hypothetical protein
VQSLFTKPPLWIKVPAAILALILGIWPRILPDWAEPLGRPFAVALVLWLALAIGWHLIQEWRLKHERPPLSPSIIQNRFLILTFALPFMALALYFEAPGAPGLPIPPLFTRMLTDFPGTDELHSALGIKLSPNDRTHMVEIVIYSDLRTMTKFVSFYIPGSAVFEVSKILATNLKTILEGPPIGTINGEPVRGKVIIEKRFKGDPDFQSSENEIFTGAVYIYYDDYMSDEERVELRKIFREQGATVIFRDKEYLESPTQ